MRCRTAPLPQLKVLFTTGYARSGIMHYGHLDPGIQLIVKPFSESCLANRVRMVLAPAAVAPRGGETAREPLHRQGKRLSMKGDRIRAAQAASR